MRTLLSILSVLLLISCADENTYRLTGDAQGFDDGTPVYVYDIVDNQPVVKDTLTINNGTFEGNFEKETMPVFNYITIGTTNDRVFYFPESEDIHVQFFKDSMRSSFAKGNIGTDSYTGFIKQMHGIERQKADIMSRYRQAASEQDGVKVAQIQKEHEALSYEEKEAKKEFLDNHTNTLYALGMLSQMVSRKEINTEEANAYLAKISPKMMETDIVKDMKATIEALKGTEIGGMAPAFSAPTPTGEELALKDALGTYTLIDFWASWCKPCRNENPNVVRVYNKYHDKGLNIISVSLDKETQKQRWIDAIRQDEMDWYHVSNLKFWSDPIAKLYGVRSIPATFLVDKDGRIVAKNLRGQALEDKIESLLGSS
jgi:peroxiredoxin